MARTVLIVDDNEDLLDAFASTLDFCTDTKVLLCTGLPQLESHRNEALACNLAILDINLGHNQPSGIDVYGWLKSAGFAGRTVFLTGHGKEHPLVKRARGIEGVEVHEKPMSVDRILEMVEAA